MTPGRLRSVWLLCALCVSAVQVSAQLTDAQKAQREAKLLRKYDANRNGKIDPDEQRQIIADIEAAKAASAAKTPVADSTLPKFSARMATGTNAAPFDLKCDLLDNPLGYDRAPQLSWKLDDIRPGARQTAYRILAASTLDQLAPGKADVWDSGKVVGDQSHLVAWQGAALVSGQRIHWKVKVWDQDGADSPWSKPAWFEVGLLRPEDWSGSWIGLRPAMPVNDEDVAAWARHAVQPGQDAAAGMAYLRERPLPVAYFRRVVRLDAAPQQARAYLAALGYAELFVNGVRIGDRRFDPAVSEYRDHALYVTHDITPYLRSGENIIAVSLAPGLYHHTGQLLDGASYDDIDRCVWGEPGFRLELRGDGKPLAATDESWKARAGATLKSLVFIGELHDARREPAGWQGAGFDDASWEKASVITPPTKRLAAMLQPAETAATVNPIAVKSPTPGVHVFDFGKRFPGAVRITLRNMKPGTRLFLRPGQQIDEMDTTKPVLHYEPPLPTRPAELRGMIDITSSGAVILPANSRAAPCWGYVCKGGAEESWEFRTTYHTVRAVELLGYEGQPTLDMLTGVEVCTDLRPTGAVETSSPAINRLHDVFTTTLRYDAHGVLVDNCCVERGGWFGDYDFIQKYFAFSFDLGEFQRKYFADIRAGEKSSGLPKVINPTPYRAANSDAHDFQASTVRIPWKHFAFYGDRHALAEHYPSMKRYVEALADKPRLQGFGEWMDPPPAGLSRKQAAEKMKLPGKMKGNRSLYTPNELAAAAVYCDAVEKTAQAAALLGHANDAARFRDLHERWKTKFISEFYDATKHDFGSQGANVLALAYGLHPDGDAPQIAATLARQVEVEHRGHLATGFSATQHIATLLSRFGHAAAAHQLFENETYPSWLFALDADDNTIGVSWASGSGKGRPNSGRSIQYSLGSGGAWFFDSLGGIEPDFTQPAFKHFTLRPIPPPKLDHATIQHETPYGIIRSAWTRKDDGIHWSFTIPPNTTATVQPPGETPREFTSGTHERVFKITPTADRR